MEQDDKVPLYHGCMPSHLLGSGINFEGSLLLSKGNNCVVDIEEEKSVTV